MIELKVTKRYVGALLQIAHEHNRVDEVEEALHILDSSIKQDRQFAACLYHPTFPRERKKKLLGALLGEEAPEIVKNFLNLAIDKKREKAFGFFYTAYKNAADELRGLVRVKVRSAAELNTSQFEHLRTVLEKRLEKKVDFESEIDKTIVGGLQVFFGTYIIDGSITGRLSRMRKHLQQHVGQAHHVT